MQAWKQFLTAQEKELGAGTVKKWLRPLSVLSFDACNLYLEAKDSFQALWFEEHIRKKTHTQLFNNNNKRIKVHLTIANVDAPNVPKTKLKKNQTSTEQPPAFVLTFDSLDPQ